MKKVIVLAAILALLAIGPMAQAITLSDWAVNPIIRVSDKIITYTGTNLPGFITIGTGFALGNTAIVNLSSFDSMQLTGQYLDYTIAIDQTMAPNDVFDAVAMGSTVLFGTTLVTKTIYEPNPDVVVSSSSTSPSSPYVLIPGNLKFLTVHEVFTGGGYLIDVSNNFRERTLPEPSSIIVLLGGLGSLLALRRRRA